MRQDTIECTTRLTVAGRCQGKGGGEEEDDPGPHAAPDNADEEEEEIRGEEGRDGIEVDCNFLLTSALSHLLMQSSK